MNFVFNYGNAKILIIYESHKSFVEVFVFSRRILMVRSPYSFNGTLMKTKKRVTQNGAINHCSIRSPS